jgi:AcrR family transcriptional regulator
MTDTEPDLPPAVEQLWGLRGSARRGGPKPALSLDRIVPAAIELADSGGLAALSMARLAERLGFTPMSLYRYVASKDDLIVLMLDAAIGPPPEGLDGDWRERCAGWAGTLRDTYRRHRWMLQVPISGLPAGPRQLAWFDLGLTALAATRLTEGERASSILLLATYVRAQTQLIVDLTSATGGVDWATVVSRLADPGRFPAVARVVAAGVLTGDPEAYPDDEFDFGLQRVLDGIEALHRSRVLP